MGIDYARLLRDLEEACAYALAATAGVADDHGTPNFDAMVLSLPSERRARVEEVARRAGLSAHKMSNGSFHFDIPERSYRARRERQAKALAEAMKARGWDATVYAKMD